MTKIAAFIRIALAYCVAAATVAGCNGPQVSAIPAGASLSELVRAICGDDGAVGIWHYPSGRVIKKHFTYVFPPNGMALSLAQNDR